MSTLHNMHQRNTIRHAGMLNSCDRVLSYRMIRVDRTDGTPRRSRIPGRSSCTGPPTGRADPPCRPAPPFLLGGARWRDTRAGRREPPSECGTNAGERSPALTEHARAGSSRRRAPPSPSQRGDIMSWMQHDCIVCGEPVPSLRASLCHCDAYEPIDDLDAD